MNRLTRILVYGVALLMGMMVAAVVVNPAEAQYPGPCGPDGRCLNGGQQPWVFTGGTGYGTPFYGTSGITDCGTRSVLAATTGLIGSIFLTEKMKNSTTRGVVIAGSTVGAGAIGCEFDKRAAQEARIEAEVARRTALARGVTKYRTYERTESGRKVVDRQEVWSEAERPEFRGEIPSSSRPPDVIYEPGTIKAYPYGKLQSEPQARPQSHHEGAVLQELVLTGDPRPDLTANEPCGRYDGEAFQTCLERLRTRNF